VKEDARRAPRDRIPPRAPPRVPGSYAAPSTPWRSAPVLAIALLPLRAFPGFTFLYAGLDKLLDPTFLDAASATSIHGQMLAFARFSPLGDLLRASLPLAVPIGVLIAVAEIGVGVGVLTGLAYHVAAAGGAALSLLFWLTASWSTRPYYYGGDLPYLLGFVTLALAGHGGVAVARRWLASVPQDQPGRAIRATSTERRVLLQTGLLALVSFIVASLAVPLRALGVRLGESGATAGSAEPSLAPTGSSPASGPSPAPSISTGGIQVATIAAVEQAGVAAFRIPFSAPSPLPAGDPGVVVHLPDGSFVAFDTICTHAGCTVEWDAADAVLLCPCHDAAFDPSHDGAVIAGPAPSPLSKLPIRVDTASGTILLAP